MVTQSVIALPPGTPLSAGNFTTIALSPDGSTVVFAADASRGSQPTPRGSQLYLRRMDRLTATPIPGTEGATKPFFSPDGTWIAYESNETGRNQVYVKPFPGPGPAHPVSTKGGARPRWSAGRLRSAERII